MKLLRVSFALFCSSFWLNSYSQGEIPVDMHTGTPSVFVPLVQVNGHDLSDMVGLSYNATGLKLEESTGQCGIGWTMQGGGSIRREVRGLPDDFKGIADSRTGWMYGTNAADIINFATSPQPDSLTSTCTDETTTYNALYNNNYLKDTEPDIFHYAVGGLSGSFVFDNNLNIRLLTYQDIKIDYTCTAPPSDNTILSFKITTNNGIVYTFDTRVYMTRGAHSVSSVEFLRRDFEYYNNSKYSAGTSYTSEWKLSRVNSPSGAYLKYRYSPAFGNAPILSSQIKQVGVKKLNSSPLALVNRLAYSVTESVNLRVLTTITSSEGDSVVFFSDDVQNPINKVEIHDRRKNPTYVKEFDLGYKSTGAITDNTNRLFLKSITEKSLCEEMPPYQFTYINVDLDSGKCALPKIDSFSKDFWGYYNGKTNTHGYPTIYVYPAEPLSQRFRLYPIPSYGGTKYTLAGADRTPSATQMQIGSLETIKYPTGGIASFNYEPNDYYDARTNSNLIGGGLRIKSIIYFDGVNTNGKIVKTYEYKEGLNSSGRLLYYPSFVIPTKQYVDPEGTTIKTYTQLSSAQDMYEYLIVRSDQDLTQSFDQSIIGYRHVKVSRPGSGSSEYDYYMPAVYGNGTSGQWSATANNFVRSSACPTMDIVFNGGRWAYPYAPNPNFDYERGFTLKRTDKNEAGIKVRESTYTPQYIYKSGAAPTKVWGVAFDNFANSTNTYFYGKYFILTDVVKPLSLETVTTYDANDATKYTTTTSQDFYESANHKLLSRKLSTGADGTLVTTKMKYPLDYGTIPSNSDVYLKAIATLQNGFRNGTPVEVTTSIQRAGDSEKIVGANIVKFSDFGITGKVLPNQQLSLKLDQGITDFIVSDKLLQGTTYILNVDGRYQTDATILGYDTYDRPLTSIGKSRIPVSTHWGFRKSAPIVQATNAQYNEFVFSNFETNSDSTKTGQEFDLSAKYFGAGRTGVNSLQSSIKLSKTVQKANVNNYKLSFWLKKSTGAVDFTINLKQTNGTIISTTTFTASPVSADFEHFEKLIAVASLPASFIVEITGNSSLSYIDDVAFFPENADLVSYNYNFPFGAVAVTDARSRTSYVEYDGLGRQKFVKDHEKNIISKTTYGVQLPTLTSNIQTQGVLQDLTQLTFTASDDPCVNDITYEWDFNEGAGYQNLGKVATHLFATAGNKTIKLRKSHPAYKSPLEVSRTFPVGLRPLNATICAKGAATIDCTTVTSTFSCASITATPTGTSTIFKVTGIDVNETPTSYSWESQQEGSTDWTVVGTGDSITLAGAGISYDIRCFVTTNTGRTGYSNMMEVTKTICKQY